ncbi:MAG TPA: SRPBCC family protein [Steroidobacteraceae bacterium]|nr:SRPBCC family protein [Steroidobacteraceae bacterium]
MSNRTLPWWMALGIAGLAAVGSQALAADYTTIVLSTVVARPAGEVWKDVGGFCDIGAWLKMKCVYTEGTGGLGTVRQLAGRIDEVMVGQTTHSYTIAQPANKDMFHATIDVEPAGPGESRIFYRMVYDQSNLAPGQTKEGYRAQHVRMFTRALASMKKTVEGSGRDSASGQ